MYDSEEHHAVSWLDYCHRLVDAYESIQHIEEFYNFTTTDHITVPHVY